MFTTAFEFTVHGGHHVIDSHEHDFRVRIECVGGVATCGATEGMVVDYRSLRRLVRSVLRPEVENVMLVRRGEESLAELKTCERFQPVPFRPTVENLAKHLFELAVSALADHERSKVASITVWENDSCMATFAA
ncbi:MAG: 6-carboxytetrahydropterin synthase [Acidimicrobiales bacterium]